jgi:hypothetical protein
LTRHCTLRQAKTPSSSRLGCDKIWHERRRISALGACVIGLEIKGALGCDRRVTLTDLRLGAITVHFEAEGETLKTLGVPDDWQLLTPAF